jgi:hypothetical protein
MVALFEFGVCLRVRMSENGGNSEESSENAGQHVEGWSEG